MKYDDLEKTKDLFDIVEEVPSPIENLEMEGANKETLEDEFTLGLTDKEEIIQKEEEPKKKKEKSKKKKSLKDKWKDLSKKKKIIFIVSLIVILVLIVALVIFLVLKKDKKEEGTNKPKEPVVIVEADNYVYKDGVLTLKDKTTELGTYECVNKDEKLCYVANYSDEDEFDGAKNVYEDESLIERRSVIYKNKYVFIYDNSKEIGGMVTLYNIEDKKSEGLYKLVKGFNNSDMVIIRTSTDKYGLLEFSEDGVKEKIAPNFDYLGRIDKDSKIVAKTTSKYYIYSVDGKAESKGVAYPIKSYNNKYIVVDNNGYYVYDYNSELINEDGQDYIRLLDDYMVLVKDKNLTVRDYKNNKYNEEGIVLDNTYFNELNVYDKDKKLVETKKAFDISIDDNGINIGFKNRNTDKTKTLVLNEGRLSANMSYLNYFDGMLYFYKDEDKNELIGKYTCSNKNNITNETTMLNNCGVAMESFFSRNEVEEDFSEHVGFIPIFNERYVFVNDTLDPNSTSINLYDLKDNKILSRYSGVDAGSYTGEAKVSFAETPSGAQLIAKNKNNKFGVISVSSEVKSVIPFNYDAIEKLRDSYMVKESSNTYVLMDRTGKTLTSRYGNKIVDYNGEYLKVIDADYYYVYDKEGNKVSDNKFYDVVLYSDYYVVVDINKRLDIHKYDDSRFSLSAPIELDEENYKIDYEVTKTRNGFSIKVKSSGKSYTVDSYGYVDDDRLPSVITP